jgi:hypothetical protein
VAHVGLDRSGHERAGIRGVVAVIAERVAHGIRNDDRGGEMNDRLGPIFAHGGRQRRRIAGIANDKRDACRHGITPSGREVVENDNFFPRIPQGMNHVAADIAGAASYQNRHRHSQCQGT